MMATHPLPEIAERPARDAGPSRPQTLFRYLLVAVGGAAALAAVLVLADNVLAYASHQPAGDRRARSLTINSRSQGLFTGTTHPAKPSAYGKFLQPQPVRRPSTLARALVLPRTDSGASPADPAASRGRAAQAPPAGPGPAPAAMPQTDASPVDAPSDPTPPADSLTR